MKIVPRTPGIRNQTVAPNHQKITRQLARAGYCLTPKIIAGHTCPLVIQATPNTPARRYPIAPVFIRFGTRTGEGVNNG
jgi:hypothetical protein